MSTECGRLGVRWFTPPIPPPPDIGGSFFSPGISQTSASVVRRSDAMNAALWRAERTALAGAMTPATTRFSHVSVSALKPSSSFISRTICTTSDPSEPALVAFQRIGSRLSFLSDRSRSVPSPSRRSADRSTCPWSRLPRRTWTAPWSGSDAPSVPTLPHLARGSAAPWVAPGG